ncbi:hypothetical protein [Paenibacillus xylanexedens]|uniref:hypothetical protein n=1 Tax=Paenibacillus sp. FSL R7-0272 TaxID=2921679 RepID=UPI0012B92E67|nr:hypothetical protein [Paenibacillus xylanexedens]
MARTISHDNLMFVKLFSAGLLLNSAKAKVELYMKKQESFMKQAIEDEYSYEMLQAYYLEEGEELLRFSEESQITAEEAEKEFYASLGELDDKEN